MVLFKKKKTEEPEDFDEQVEEYRGEPEKKYSHEVLVMEQYRTCLHAGSQEMRKGWEERKISRTGEVMSIKTHPDTRKEFAECVITMKMLLIGYIEEDEESNLKIQNLFIDLENLYKKFMELEQWEWDKIPAIWKHPSSNWQNRWEHINRTLNYDYVYGEKYLQDSILIYRKILEEITKLMHKMGYFKGERIG